jgi:hypothetical protein
MRLTPNQQETLHEIAVGNPGGQLLKPIPSLIERGLVTTAVIPGVCHEPTRSWVRPTRTEYRLTPLGLDEYTKLCVTWHEAALKKVDTTFRDNIAQAQARTVT